MQHAYAAVNGIRLHYVATAPRAAAPLILFVHGFPEFWYAWKEQLAEFGKDHHAVAPDLRGFNLSDKPADVNQYRAPFLMEDIRALIGHLGHRRCVLVAHDWGGAVAWNLAAALPDYVEKLVIINSPHPALFARELTSNPAQQAASAYMNFFCTPGAEAALAANGFALLGKALEWGRKDDPFTAEDKRAYLEAWAQPGALTASLNYYRVTPLRPPRERDPGAAALPRGQLALTVRVPTLVIWGEADTVLLPGLLDGLESYVPDLTVTRVARAGHWIVHEHPRLVSQAIRDFLGRTPR